MTDNGEGTGRRGDLGSMAGTFVYVLFGPVVWALHLTAIYGAQLLCAGASTNADIIVPIVVGATAAALALLTATIWRPGLAGRPLGVCTRSSDERQFLDRLMRLLAALSIPGVAWAGATAFILEPCAPLR